MKFINRNPNNSYEEDYRGIELSGFSEALQFAQLLGQLALDKIDSQIGPDVPEIFSIIALQNRLLNDLNSGSIAEDTPFTYRFTGRYAELRGGDLKKPIGLYTPNKYSASSTGFKSWHTSRMDAVW